MREEDLAKELKLHAKQLRKIIRHFEEQNLIMRDHRKEVCAEKKTMFLFCILNHIFSTMFACHFFPYSALLLILINRLQKVQRCIVLQ